MLERLSAAILGRSPIQGERVAHWAHRTVGARYGRRAVSAAAFT